MFKRADRKANTTVTRGRDSDWWELTGIACDDKGWLDEVRDERGGAHSGVWLRVL